MTEAEYKEWQANQFAMALLMPRDAVRLYAQRLRPDTEFEAAAGYLSVVFDVPLSVAKKRLKQLGLFVGNR